MLNSFCGHAIFMLVLLDDSQFCFRVFTEMIKKHLFFKSAMLACQQSVFWGQGYDAQLC